MKNYLLILSSLFVLLLGICSCSDDNENEESGKGITIKGLVEKGPFISGSSVTVYELDDNLNGTGRVFEAKTNDEGAFSINTSTALVSKYVKLSVIGYYFNEYTGRLSDSQIMLDAITTTEGKDGANINVNVLTHLEMPRVMQLITSGKSFDAAKKQAEKELLSAFLITNETIIPEEASITANNTSANILIAISSILLNERSDAQFSEFMSILRTDLSDGEISQTTKNKIAESSLGLRYTNIKNNIQERYKELGKNVEVGNFELFIDGDGDGEIGEPYDEGDDISSPEDIFQNVEMVKRFFQNEVVQLYSFIQNQYLFDALYTNKVDENKINTHYEFRLIYEHNLNAHMALISNLWSSSYKTIAYDNVMIENIDRTGKEDFYKYKYFAKVYRAYKYLKMIELWGDVPFVTQSEYNDYRIPRTPQEEILNYISGDLEEAIPHLPDNSHEAECSKYFAIALQARIQMYQKNYSKALESLNKIMNSGKYELSADINSIYTGNNKEIIFEIIHNVDMNTNIYFNELIKKGAYTPFSRYTEIILLASEANLRLGNKSKAADLLNQVRQRNQESLVDPSSDIESILLTQWNDLTKEGFNFNTLKRFDKAKQTLNIEDFQLLLPIPISELNSNPSIIQNPKY